MREFGFVIVCLSSVGVAGYALVAYTWRPLGSVVHPEMRVAFQAHRIGIYAHIFASAVALLAGPWQFLPAVRSRWPQVHRVLGQAYLLVGVGVGGAAALYMSRFAFGGVVSTAGFGLLVLAWLYTGVRGYRAARQRAWAAHRRWMIRNFGLALAAVTLRVYLGLGFALGLSFEVFYPVLAWLSWVPNAVVAECIARQHAEPGATLHPAHI